MIRPSGRAASSRAAMAAKRVFALSVVLIVAGFILQLVGSGPAAAALDRPQG
jgi:hypothetical protein